MTLGLKQSQFATRSGHPLPLIGMTVTGVIEGCVAVIETAQTYRNDETANIEAVYTFPLPVAATLLNLSVQLGDKTLSGTVVARAKAEQQYEEALDQGDTAVMLEQVEPGLYTLNLGNLLAGEQATVCLRFALPLTWEGDQIRLALPTTVAPRYGNAAEAGVQPHQLPEPDLLTEHRYSLNLRILGELANTTIACPSHSLALQRTDEGLSLQFEKGQALADRDLVLTLRSPSLPHSTLCVVSDGQHHVAHAVFAVPPARVQRALRLKILIDCSGSMKGDSIALAKLSAILALRLLQRGDHYCVSAFGGHVVHDPTAHGRLLAATADTTLPASIGFIESLDANLGGTALQAALESVFGIDPSGTEEAERGGDILLITDGESWDRDRIVNACRASGHRIFVVGIGSSPAECLVRQIAEATGGAATFLSPREEARPAIERHLLRMRSPLVQDARLEGGESVLWQSPSTLVRRLFSGDTLHLYLGLASPLSEPLRLQIRFADGGSQVREAEPTTLTGKGIEATDLIRIGASARIAEMDFGQAQRNPAVPEAIAVTHQVMSPYTNYLLIADRGEQRAGDLPALRKVSPMLAAGWGGVGSVQADSFAAGAAAAPRGGRRRMAHYDAPMFLRQPIQEPTPQFLLATPATAPTPYQLISKLNEDFGLINPERHLKLRLSGDDGWSDLDLGTALFEGLRRLVNSGWSEEQVMLAFWLAVLELKIGARVSRMHRRGIHRGSRKAPVPTDLVKWLAVTLRDTSDGEWRWSEQSTAPRPQSLVAAGLS